MASRDELIALLVVDAYNDLADALAAAAAGRHDGAGEGLLAVAMAYRAWVLAHPADFGLILGTPVPGSHAPAELTMSPARRALLAFLGLLADAWRARRLPLPPPSRRA